MHPVLLLPYLPHFFYWQNPGGRSEVRYPVEPSKCRWLELEVPPLKGLKAKAAKDKLDALKPGG